MRVTGIEPVSLAWEANVLPLNQTRKSYQLKIFLNHFWIA